MNNTIAALLGFAQAWWPTMLALASAANALIARWYTPTVTPTPAPAPIKVEVTPVDTTPVVIEKPPEPKPQPKPEPPMPAPEPKEEDARVVAYKNLLALLDQIDDLIPNEEKRKIAKGGLEAYVSGMFSDK